MVRPVNLKEVELTGLCGKAASFVENRKFVNFITIIILVNAAVLGLETNHYALAKLGPFLNLIDSLVIAVFCVEIGLKLFAYRLSFFRSGWNVFDFLVVAASLMPSSGPFAVLRVLRVLRILRLMSVVPQMRRVVSALFQAMPGMASVIGVLLILYYVYAVFATQTFGAHSDPDMQLLFGTLPASFFTLFQLMTLENWTDGVARPTMILFPWSWAYFVSFIIVTGFAVLNLFIGIIVDAMNIVQVDDLEEEKEDIEACLHKEVGELRGDIGELKAMIKSFRSDKNLDTWDS